MTIGFGAAAVISGVASALLWPRGEQSTQTTSVACVPSTNMVSCALRF
jgi:hypothetical protein